ncbi:MAG TPA: M15 family metallopeptidase [Acidimicrobiia bacterium]|nr:M15 family metallopeptidase [Acidimicrobiia bacterium]
MKRLLLLALALIVGAPPAPALATSDSSVRWTSFSESSTCGEPYTRPTYMTKSGAVPSDEPILGPFGTYFGRTLSQVKARLVSWEVPGSGGQKVLVHQTALPAFQEVAQTLAQHAAAGRVYPITSVSTFVARTLRGGSHQLSRHALGLAIDMNYSANPYREDGKLITNMPAWFVDSWKEAGFCWGGDWPSFKDPMHFSWLGPRASGSDPLTPLPPLTSKRPFPANGTATATVFGPVTDRYRIVLADGTGNGAVDVIGLRSHPDGSVLDIATGTHLFDGCSIVRWFLPDPHLAGAEIVLLADIDGDSGQDLIVLNRDGNQVTATIATRRSRFADITTIDTALNPDLAAVTAADFDGDHQADLWMATSDGSLLVYQGPSFDTVIHEAPLPAGAPLHLAAGDRDGGNTPELFALYAGSPATISVFRLDGAWQLEQTLTIGFNSDSVVALGPVDYDGDGRADFEVLDDAGRLHAYIGNSPTGRPATSWFVNPARECPEEPVRLVYHGTFFDDDHSVHQSNIEAMAQASITFGCNPPFNDRYCPERTVTRAQAAAFIARALRLPATSHDFFTDDNGHTLEAAINQLAAGGITFGCNPPSNDRFCPDEAVTRAQFAAFVARALQLPATNHDFFTDDNGHTLEAAINQLAAAGIARGCDPPANTQFCPQRTNTRAEAATFLARALDLGE